MGGEEQQPVISIQQQQAEQMKVYWRVGPLVLIFGPFD